MRVWVTGARALGRVQVSVVQEAFVAVVALAAAAVVAVVDIVVGAVVAQEFEGAVDSDRYVQEEEEALRRQPIVHRLDGRRNIHLLCKCNQAERSLVCLG